MNKVETFGYSTDADISKPGSFWRKAKDDAIYIFSPMSMETYNLINLKTGHRYAEGPESIEELFSNEDWIMIDKGTVIKITVGEGE